MKLVTVQFEDSVDITVLPIGEPVSITNGTDSIDDGSIMSQTVMIEPELVDHTHGITLSGQTAEVGLPVII